MHLESRFLGRDDFFGGPNIPRMHARTCAVAPEFGRRTFRFEGQLEDDATASTGGMNDDVLVLDQPAKMNPRLRAPDSEMLSDFTSREADVADFEPALLRKAAHHAVEEVEHPPRHR